MRRENGAVRLFCEKEYNLFPSAFKNTVMRWRLENSVWVCCWLLAEKRVFFVKTENNLALKRGVIFTGIYKHFLRVIVQFFAWKAIWKTLNIPIFSSIFVISILSSLFSIASCECYFCVGFCDFLRAYRKKKDLILALTTKMGAPYLQTFTLLGQALFCAIPIFSHKISFETSKLQFSSVVLANFRAFLLTFFHSTLAPM